MATRAEYLAAMDAGDYNLAETILAEQQQQHAQMTHPSGEYNPSNFKMPLTGTDKDVYDAMSQEVENASPFMSPFKANVSYKGRDTEGRTEVDTSWGLDPYMTDDKMTLGAGHAASMLMSGIKDIGDYGLIGMSKFDSLSPFNSNKQNANLQAIEDAAKQRIGNRAVDYDDNGVANKALTDRYGIPGFIGGMMPYIAGAPLVSGTAAKAGTAVADTLEGALRFAVQEPKNLVSKFFQKVLPDRAKKEFVLPKAYAKEAAANTPKDFKYDPRAGLVGVSVGNMLLGALDGYLRPDMNTGIGALGGLLGSISNTLSGPALSHINNPKLKGLNDIDTDTLNVAERNGWVPDLGMRYNKPKLQADLAKQRGSSDSLDQVAAFDSNRQLALNRWALRSIFGVKPEVANKMDAIDPEFINGYMKSLGKQLDDIDANSVGRFDKDAIDRINEHTKNVYSDVTFIKDGTANLVKNYNDAIHGYRETATRLTPQTLTTDDYNRIVKSLNDVSTKAEYGKFKAADNMVKLIGFTKNMQGSKFLTPEHLSILDAHLSKLKSKAEVSQRPEAMQYYNDVANAFTPLKEHLVNIRNPSGQFVSTVDGLRLMNLRRDIADEIRGAEAKGDARKANALRPILKEINAAQDAGIKHGGTVSSQTASQTRANYAMAKEMLNGGIHPNGNVSLDGVNNLVTSNTRMLEDALRGVGLQGHTVQDTFGSSIDPKSTMQHMARLFEVVKRQKNADLSKKSKASPDHAIQQLTRNPGSDLPSPYTQFVTNKLMYGGWPRETGFLGLPYKDSVDKYGVKSGGVLSSNNLYFSGHQQKESNKKYSTSANIKSLFE